MAKTFDPGQVAIRLTLAADRVAAVGVASVRPDVAGLLCGQAAEQAVALVPLIYSLCGKAQGIAARAALAVARGVDVPAHVDPEALAEAAREHAWQLLVNWPRQLGLAPDEPLFVRTVRTAAAQRAELALDVAASPVVAALRERLAGSSQPADILLLERVAVRLAELLDFLAGRPLALGTVSATAAGAGRGCATVATARGSLVHELTLHGDRVADYVITAPTDLHFAAAGPVADWLAQLHGLPREQAVAMVERAVMAFDPCVPCVCEML
jgi:hypothetical protein